ncbi:MAG TPA: hypothetical protein EYN71_07200, partial [Flavobacteriales bacterium]|nr:hypothetical protein [Flavobacteriales bacterium]
MKTLITILTGMLMLALGNFSSAQTCQASYTYSISGSSCYVQFINTSTGAFSYVWDFDDGNTSALTSPIHLYNSNGNYWPVLFAYDSLGNLCDSAYQPITLNCSNPC